MRLKTIYTLKKSPQINISKILEKIVYKWLNSFLTLNNIFNSSQFGFRTKLSTNFAITELLDKVIQSFSNKEHVIALSVKHSTRSFRIILVIYILDNYGIRGSFFYHG